MRVDAPHHVVVVPGHPAARQTDRTDVSMDRGRGPNKPDDSVVTVPRPTAGRPGRPAHVAGTDPDDAVIAVPRPTAGRQARPADMAGMRPRGRGDSQRQQACRHREQTSHAHTFFPQAAGPDPHAPASGQPRSRNGQTTARSYMISAAWARRCIGIFRRPARHGACEPLRSGRRVGGIKRQSSGRGSGALDRQASLASGRKPLDPVGRAPGSKAPKRCALQCTTPPLDNSRLRPSRDKTDRLGTGGR